MSTWWPLLVLLSRCPIFKSSNYLNSSYVAVTPLKIGHPYILSIGAQSQWLDYMIRYQDSSRSNGILSTVATDAQVLKHHAISIHKAEWIFIVLDQFHAQDNFTVKRNNFRKHNYIVIKLLSCLMLVWYQIWNKQVRSILGCIAFITLKYIFWFKILSIYVSSTKAIS